MRKSQVDRKVVKYTTTVGDGDDDELAQVFILEHFYIHLSIQYRTWDSTTNLFKNPGLLFFWT